MATIRTAITLLSTLALGACTRTVVIRPGPEPERRGPPPSTAATLGIPPGHLPRPGECRVWIPGTPPGRQPGARSRRCEGIAAQAPAGSWIVYRPTRDRKLVHVRVVDERRAGIVIVVRIFDVDTGRFIREERPQPEDRPRPDERPRLEEPPQPVEPPRPEERPRPEEPTRPVERPGPEERPEPNTSATLGIPPGHLPNPGECRIWIPGTPPGQQRHRASNDCDGIARQAPAGSWIVYRPTRDRKFVHVRVVDERRAGVVIRVRIFEVDTGKFVREENP